MTTKKGIAVEIHAIEQGFPATRKFGRRDGVGATGLREPEIETGDNRRKKEPLHTEPFNYDRSLMSVGLHLFPSNKVSYLSVVG